MTDVKDLNDFLDDFLPTFSPKSQEEIIEACMNSDTAMDNWLDDVRALGIRHPDTVLVPFSVELHHCMSEAGDLSEAAMANLLEIQKAVEAAGKEYGFPLFFKSSFVSAKHYWDETCCLKDSELASIGRALSDFAMMQSMSPNPYAQSVAIRKMIPVNPAFHAFQGNMPVTKEFRVFALNGEVEGYQPYWPKDSILEPSCDDWEQKLAAISTPTSTQIEYMVESAGKLTKKLGGYWSVNFLEDKDGNLWLIDMAEGHLSYRDHENFVQIEGKRKKHEATELGA